jgi:Bardet-Biedl syndrome 1 protein
MLLDVPVSLCVTYTDSATPRIPSMVVAAGSHIFIYRHLRPYRKWTCPPIDIDPTENSIWKDYSDEKIDTDGLFSMLLQVFF